MLVKNTDFMSGVWVSYILILQIGVEFREL